ncbi:hypothetical protein ACLB2K_038093 [Fragaria x ananassa]
MQVEGDRYALRFKLEEDRKHVLEGTWFNGRNLFVVSPYDGLCAASHVSILTFLVYIEILGLYPAIITKDDAVMVGAMLGVVEDYYKIDIKRSEKARVLVRHLISDHVKQAYP